MLVLHVRMQGCVCNGGQCDHSLLHLVDLHAVWCMAVQAGRAQGHRRQQVQAPHGGEAGAEGGERRDLRAPEAGRSTGRRCSRR